MNVSVHACTGPLRLAAILRSFVPGSEANFSGLVSNLLEPGRLVSSPRNHIPEFRILITAPVNSKSPALRFKSRGKVSKVSNETPGVGNGASQVSNQAFRVGQLASKVGSIASKIGSVALATARECQGVASQTSHGTADSVWLGETAANHRRAPLGSWRCGFLAMQCEE